jgi:hypothetical protein
MSAFNFDTEDVILLLTQCWAGMTTITFGASASLRALLAAARQTINNRSMIIRLKTSDIIK